VYTQGLKNAKELYAGPPGPQFWGEITRDLGFLPPFLWPCGLELGSHFRGRVRRLKESGAGWGANAGLNEFPKTGVYTVAQVWGEQPKNLGHFPHLGIHCRG
jgi:hypothetical protein